MIDVQDIHKINVSYELPKQQSDSMELKYEDEEEEKAGISTLRISPTTPNGKNNVNPHVKWHSHGSFQITPNTDYMIDKITEENKDDIDPYARIVGHPLHEMEEHSSSLTNDDDDIETEANATRKPSLIGSNKNHKYPYYINKALFHVSDDENLEVLVDEAVLKLLSFNELWQDQDGFVRCLYNDGEFASAVKRVYETLAGIYFHVFSFSLLAVLLISAPIHI